MVRSFSVDEEKHASSRRRKKVHLVVAGASQWGQYACARVLHRVVAKGGRVTLIVARRHEELFRTCKPSIEEWASYPSLYDCIEGLRRANQPIESVFDDHLHHLAAELLRQGSEYLRLGYVVTGAEEHYPYARILATCCDRVLIEKPVSKLFADVRPNGRFIDLVRDDDQGSTDDKTGIRRKIFSCEHFAFRKGFSDTLDYAGEFIRRHRQHKLLYHFRFFETSRAEDLTHRLAAMQDGSLLDLAITHGLGPLSYLLWRLRTLDRPVSRFASLPGDALYNAIKWQKILPLQARERLSRKARLLAPVLAETAVRLEGTCSHHDEIANDIELVLESGKGVAWRDRFLRLECLTCSRKVERAQRRADKIYIGISLAAAGFTVCDFKRAEQAVRDLPEEKDFADADSARGEDPLRLLVHDGGWRSDLLAGSSSEAENAQAAMLEAFIDEDLDDRFIPLDEACQIVRLGIEAQALAFCGQRGAYTLGSDKVFKADEFFEPWSERRSGFWENHPEWRRDWGPHHDRIREIWQAAKDSVPVLEMLGLGKSQGGSDPCFRVVTFLGPEGFGNTDSASILYEELQEACGSKVDIHLLNVSRDEHWCQGEGSGKSTRDRLIRDLTKALEMDTAAADDLVRDLLGRIIDCRAQLETEPRVLIFNGVDRLGDEPWAHLIRLLNELPKSHRLIFVTNRGDQACGLVIQTYDLARYFKRLEGEKNRAGDSTRGYRRRLEALDYHDELQRGLRELLDESPFFGLRWHELLTRIRLLAMGNATIERQLCIWLLDVVLHRFGKTQEPAADQIWGELERALVSIAVPRTLTPFPERLLDRISLACLAALAPEDLRALAVFARLPDGVPASTLQATFPDLTERIGQRGPLRSVFLRTEMRGQKQEHGRGELILFPRVRRALVLCEPNSVPQRFLPLDDLRHLEREMEDRRLLLALPTDERHVDARLERLLAIGERGEHGLGRLDLDGTLAEECCLDLAESFEIGIRGRIDSRPARLLKMLIQQPTNLSMTARARLHSLYAWADLGRATEAVAILAIMNKLAGACAVVQHFRPFTMALGALFTEAMPELAGEGCSERQLARDRRDKELEVETHRNLLLAEIFLTYTWHWLLGIERQPTYVFPQQYLLTDSVASLEMFSSEADQQIACFDDRGERWPADRLRRLQSQVLTTLSLFEIHEAGSAHRQGNLRQTRKLLEEAAKLTEKALSRNLEVSNDSNRLQAGRGACLNRLNLVLIKSRLTEIAPCWKRSKYRRSTKRSYQQASEQIDQVGKSRARFGVEPYLRLTEARLVKLKILRQGDEKGLAEEARRIYKRRGQDYFAELAKAVAHAASKTAIMTDKLRR